MKVVNDEFIWENFLIFFLDITSDISHRLATIRPHTEIALVLKEQQLHCNKEVSHTVYFAVRLLFNMQINETYKI